MQIPYLLAKRDSLAVFILVIQLDKFLESLYVSGV